MTCIFELLSDVNYFGYSRSCSAGYLSWRNGGGGDVFLLDMGKPVKILDLAKRMTHLSGSEVKNDDNRQWRY
jgi:hypothetical protein